jgi:hypothetical protein
MNRQQKSENTLKAASVPQHNHHKKSVTIVVVLHHVNLDINDQKDEEDNKK